MTRQLDYDDVVAINRKFTNGGGVAIDESVIRSAVGRPFHGFGGVEFYPTLIGKAAALLHALASTQGFIDGNKRTAWMSCVTFLRVNGIILSVRADEYAADFVLQLLSGALTLEQAQEWIIANIQE